MLLISGFVESAAPIAGGIWMWDGARLRELYTAGGAFGLTWWRGGSILIGGTRDDANPFVAFARTGNDLRPLTVRYERFLNGRRIHGVAVDDTRIYAVASQGDPDSPVSSNTDRWHGHRVGKVLMSDLWMDGDALVIGNTEVWNPYQCDHHHHINDILLDGAFIYLSSFSTCDQSKRLIDRGAVARFHKTGLFDRIVCDALRGPHSLQRVDDRIFVCSSEESAVVSFPADGLYAAARLEYKGINNFVRGLAVTPKHFFIGCSRSAGRSDGERFTEPNNGVLKFDRANGASEWLQLPDICENVYSAMPFDGQAATARNRVIYSCVMDAKPKYIAQTRVLVETLLGFAGCDASDIVVHAVGGADAETQAFLDRRGVRVVPVNEFDPRHAYANKLAQLSSAALQEADYVVLCDTDLAFCGDISDAVGDGAIRAKPVDYANFTVEDWQRIVSAANLPMPPLTVSTHDRQPTLVNYCNTGMLIVERTLLSRLAAAWPRWNTFLLDNPELLGRFARHDAGNGRVIHHPLTDQVSLALALTEMGISIDPLRAEYNMPTHVQQDQHDVHATPRVLHYHDRIDAEGCLTATGVTAIDAKIADVNALLRRVAEMPA